MNNPGLGRLGDIVDMKASISNADLIDAMHAHLRNQYSSKVGRIVFKIWILSILGTLLPAMCGCYPWGVEVMFLIVGIGFVVVAKYFRKEMYIDKTWRLALTACARAEVIYSEAQQSPLYYSDASEYSKLVDVCFTLCRIGQEIVECDHGGWQEESASEWDRKFNKIKDKLQQMSFVVGSSVRRETTSASKEIERLAELRCKGIISDHEFQAFSERFKVTTGEKSEAIVQAIGKLFAQYEHGAMSEGNYHAGLWSLLDKLDRKT